MTQVTRISQLALTRCTMKPMAILLRAPETGAGRKRSDVSVGVRSCTRWKKKVRMVSRALNDPHVKKTAMQIAVKALLRQSEF